MKAGVAHELSGQIHLATWDNEGYAREVNDGVLEVKMI